MHLEHYPPEKLKKEILEIIGKRLNLSKYRVFFFGSRVSEKGTDRSDIDIGIEGPPIQAGIWFEIEEEIEEFPALYKIDLVDFQDVSDKFRNVALRAVEPLNNYVKI